MDSYSKQWHSRHKESLIKRQQTRTDRLERLGRRRDRKQITVPSVIDFQKNYEETVKFIGSIKDCVFQEDRFAFLDFSECKEISAEACVVLAAEIDRCRRRMLNSVSGSYPENFDVYSLLNGLGFFKMLKIQAIAPTFHDPAKFDVVKLRSGKEFKEDHPENLMRGIKELFFTENKEKFVTPYGKKIYRALTEAAYNTAEHAYPLDFVNKERKTCVPVWWRAGFKNKKDNMVFIVLYDQGAGIPNTLNTNWRKQLEKLSSVWGGKPPDHEKIKLAMDLGKSGTETEGRGRGSNDMQSIIRENLGGFLSIFSYNGKYVYSSRDKCETELLSHRLGGTLVTWKISLDKRKN